MKNSKLKTVVEKYPWVALHLAAVRHLYGYKRGNKKDLAEFQDYVRQNISFVAFRPWESLDFLARSTKNSSSFGRTDHMLHKVVEYEVLWHSNENEPFSQRQSYAHISSDPTVGQLISGIINFRVNYPCTEKHIYIDAVIKRSYTYSTILGDHTGESFEIYLCPENWMFDWMKTDQHILRTLRAKGISVQGLPIAA